jgi:coenzyme F420-reducing hydrogenase beta subunit
MSKIENVVSGGYCIGCGACATQNKDIKIIENQYGNLVALIPQEINDKPRLSEICPFASTSNETQIAEKTFPLAPIIDASLGRMERAYKGYSNKYRKYGSSGGIGTHILANLLETNAVDAVICVGPSENRLVEYQVLSKVDDLLKCSTSFYYPVSLNDVIQIVKERPGRYAITGVPCFHKAIRLLKESDPVLNERIVYQVGLVCGHMKSAHYAEYLARKVGKPAEAKLKKINFRNKEGSKRADDYNFVATWVDSHGDDITQHKSVRQIGVNWAMGYFKPKACDFCDDVFAECADVSIMDAWLPGLVEDAQGTSLVIARSVEIAQLLESEISHSHLQLTSCTTSELITSQASGLRHRREGLSFRLWLTQKMGLWAPTKRVNKSIDMSRFYMVEMLMRIWMRQLSRSAFRLELSFGNGLRLFNGLMSLPIFAYKVFGKARRKFENK